MMNCDYFSRSSEFQYETSTVLRNGIHSLYLERLNVSCIKGVHFGFSGFRARAIPACCGVRPPFFLLHS